MAPLENRPNLLNSARRGRVRQSPLRLLGAWLLAVLLAPLACASEPTAGASGQAVTPPPEYEISAEDVLDISVWREPDLQRQVIVRPDGGISFPLVGDIEAAGKTPAQLQDDLVARLETYIPDAVVTVSVVELRGLRIYVTGKVRNPGQFLVGRYVDVLQAITLAGGLTPFANQRDITIRRREGGREVVYEFDYAEVERGRNLSQNIQLRADDVVVVP